MTDPTTTLTQIKKLIADFRAERNWINEDPKDIAIGLSLEANEVLDILQWRSWEEVEKHPHAIDGLKDELADVLFYLGMMANRLNIDLASAFEVKLQKSREKFPLEIFTTTKSPAEKQKEYYRIKAKYRGNHPLHEDES